MPINLFEIIAQVINFFVLLFILKKLFYNPVTEIMEKRQRNIEENIEEAERKNKEAHDLIQQYNQKLSEIDNEKTEQMNAMRKEAKEYKNNLVATYKKEAEDKKVIFFQEVEEGKEAFSAELRKLMAKGTVDISRDLFDGLENKALDRHLFESLLGGIRSFAAGKKERDAVQGAGRFVLISTDKVDGKMKQQVQQVLEENRIEVETMETREDESLGAGYVLQMPDYTIYSSINHFLDKKEDQLLTFLEQAVRDGSEHYDTEK